MAVITWLSVGQLLMDVKHPTLPSVSLQGCESTISYNGLNISNMTVFESSSPSWTTTDASPTTSPPVHVSTTCYFMLTCPVWTRERCRISPSLFLVECHMRRLNQSSFVLLYFVLFAFWVVFSLCTSLYCLVYEYQSRDWLWRRPPK